MDIGQTHPFVPKVHIFAYFSLLTLFSFYFNILMMVLVLTSHLPQNTVSKVGSSWNYKNMNSKINRTNIFCILNVSKFFPKDYFYIFGNSKECFFFKYRFYGQKYHIINPCGTSSPSNMGLFPAIPLIQVLPNFFNLFNIRIYW